MVDDDEIFVSVAPVDSSHAAPCGMKLLLLAKSPSICGMISETYCYVRYSRILMTANRCIAI
jgi:hypothetical protein